MYNMLHCLLKRNLLPSDIFVPAVVKSSVDKILTLKLEKSGRLHIGGSNALYFHNWPKSSYKHRFYTLLGVD